MTTKELVHIHQKYKAKSDNTGIAALRNDGKLTDNTTEKANIINSQFQKAFPEETTSEPIPVKGKSNYSKMKNITQSKQGNWHRSNLWKSTE
jgi:hypothetical protein